LFESIDEFKAAIARGENVCCLFRYVYSFTGESNNEMEEQYKLGRGFMHITGKGNYEAIYKLFLKANNKKEKDYTMNMFIQDLTNNLDVAMEASMIYWKMNKINKHIDEKDNKSNKEFRNEVRKVGGIINLYDSDAEENQIGKFNERYNRSLLIFKRIKK
jgi:hypothetical protein